MEVSATKSAPAVPVTVNNTPDLSMSVDTAHSERDVIVLSSEAPSLDVSMDSDEQTKSGGGVLDRSVVIVESE